MPGLPHINGTLISSFPTYLEQLGGNEHTPGAKMHLNSIQGLPQYHRRLSDGIISLEKKKKKNLNKKEGSPQREDKALLGPIGPFLI